MTAYFVARVAAITHSGSVSRRISQYNLPFVVKANGEMATADAFGASVPQQDVAHPWVGAEYVCMVVLGTSTEPKLETVCRIVVNFRQFLHGRCGFPA